MDNVQYGEPFKFDAPFMVDKDGEIIGIISEMGGSGLAERIMLCVNACRFQSNENLSDDCVEKMRKDRDLLMKQKEVLINALSFYADGKNWAEDDWGVLSIIGSSDYGNPGYIAREAIKQTKELK